MVFPAPAAGVAASAAQRDAARRRRGIGDTLTHISGNKMTTATTY